MIGTTLLASEGFGDLAAVAATVIAAVASFAHVHCVVIRRDRAGVSTTSAGLAVVTELTWMAYLLGGRLWWAVPESVLMEVTALAVLGPAAVRWRGQRTTWSAMAVWLIVILAAARTTGRGGVGFLLTWSYAIEVAPAIWTAWTTAAPTGVVGLSWALTAVEGALWGCYGLAVGDRALLTFAALTVTAALAMLGRKAVTTSCRRRRPVPAGPRGDPVLALRQIRSSISDDRCRVGSRPTGSNCTVRRCRRHRQRTKVSCVHHLLCRSAGVGAGDESEGDAVGARSDDGADDARPVAVVLVVVRDVDRRLVGVGPVGEGDVGFDTTGTDPAGAAGRGAPVPAVIGSVSGADVEVVAGADDPHRHVRAQRAVRSAGGELQFGGVADAGELVVGPAGHSDPTRIRDLIARRSSIAV